MDYSKRAVAKVTAYQSPKKTNIMNVRDYFKARWEIEAYQNTHNIFAEMQEEFPIGTPIYDVEEKYLGRVRDYLKLNRTYILVLHDDNGNDYGMIDCNVLAHRIAL